MSKKNPKSKNRKAQSVAVILRDGDGHLLLEAGRRPAHNDKDDDAVYFLAPHPDGTSEEVTAMLDEAEDYLDAVSTLVSDVDARPFCGHLVLDTRAGESGGSLQITVADPHDPIASVRVEGSSSGIGFDAPREPLERFLFAVREGICEDIEDDD